MRRYLTLTPQSALPCAIFSKCMSHSPSMLGSLSGSFGISSLVILHHGLTALGAMMNLLNEKSELMTRGVNHWPA
eukprot:8213239-Karenia_brevis.AAC.1